MSFPRYPAYKDSGVEWLDAVPSHWHVTALKREFSVTLGKMLQTDASSPEDVLGPYLRAANIQWSGVDASDIKTMWLSVRDVLQLRLLPGDLLISEGGDVGRSCLWQGELEECYFQNSVNRVRPINGGSTRFLYYWMSTIKDKGYVDVLCNKSTIAHFTAEKVAAVPVPIPPNSEQESISHFLDRETAKIDALVAEQEQLITLLKEKRQAVISHAVTKGLDPSVPMKDSGVEWLGEVPAHWTPSRIKFSLSGLIDTEHKTVPFVDDGEYLVVRTSNIRNGRLLLDDAKYTDQAGFDEWTRRAIPKAGDIIFTREAPAGEAWVVDGEIACCLGQRTVLMQIDTRVLAPQFALWSIYGGLATEFVALLSQGSTVAHFNMSDIGSIPLLLPPIDEQLRVATQLKTATEQIDELLTEATAAISLLQERRSALISAAVTGQIDVRGLAPAQEQAA